MFTKREVFNRLPALPFLSNDSSLVNSQALSRHRAVRLYHFVDSTLTNGIDHCAKAVVMGTGAIVVVACDVLEYVVMAEGNSLCPGF